MSKTNIHVAICTPAYGGQLTTIYTDSLLKTLDLFRSHNIKCTPMFLNNESLVQRGRNTLVAQALAIPDVTHVLFIDADIQWSPESMMRLFNKDVDIVGGIYPHKHYCFERLVDPKMKSRIQSELDAWKELEEVGGNKQIDEVTMSRKLRSFLLRFNLVFPRGHTSTKIQNGFVQVERIATGMMLIKRKVFETMMKAHPEWNYVPNTMPHKSMVERLTPFNYAFFDCKIDEYKQYLSEDWYFCSEWKKLGGEVWADITMPLSHGGFHVFSGSVSNTLVSFRQRLEQSKQQSQTTNTLVKSEPVPIEEDTKKPVTTLVKQAENQKTEIAPEPSNCKTGSEQIKSISKQIMTEIDSEENKVKEQVSKEQSHLQAVIQQRQKIFEKYNRIVQNSKFLTECIPRLQSAMQKRIDVRKSYEKKIRDTVEQEKSQLNEIRETKQKIKQEEVEQMKLKKELDKLKSDENQLKQNVEQGKKILEQFPEQRKIAREMEAEQIAKLADSASVTSTESKVEEDDPIARLIREAEEAALKGEAM